MPGQAVSANASARLDRLPIGSFHKRLLVLVGAGLFFDAFDIYLANSVLGALVATGWSTLGWNATFLSATAFGMLLGSVLAGVLGDRYGRKFTYQFNLAVFGLASLACAAAPSIAWLVGARFVTGVGLGAELVIGYGLLSEFVPPSHRGRWAALLSCMAQCGLFAATLMSWIVIPALGWRAMFVIAGVGGLAVFVARKNIPESPRWLENNGHAAEADAVVGSIEAGVGAAAARAAPEPGPVVSAPAVHPFAPAFRKPLALGALTQIVQSASVYGFVAWVPTFLLQQGMPINQSLGQSVLMSFGGPAGALIAFLLSDRIGRKPAVIGGSILAAIVGPLFALAGSQVSATGFGFLMFTLVYFLVSVIQAGYLPELFPTEVRMRLTSLAVTAGRLTSIATPFLVVSLVQAGGMIAVVGVVAALLLVQAVAMALVGVETSRRSLEAIASNTAAEPSRSSRTRVAS